MNEELLTSSQLAELFRMKKSSIIQYAARKKDFRGWTPEKAPNGHNILWRKVDEK